MAAPFPIAASGVESWVDVAGSVARAYCGVVGESPSDGAGRPGRGRRLLLALLTGVLVVAIGFGVLWAVQRQLIYFPDDRDVPPADAVIVGARDVTLHTADGLELGAWFVPEPAGAAARGMAVLVAPGNGGNRLDRAGLAEALRDRGFAVLLLDYRGYGGNPGTPSEEGLAADADAASEALADLGYPPERVIYFGESLGTGVVAALQARTQPAGVVLRSPFTELADVGAHHYPFLPVRMLLRDRFPVIEHVADSEVPMTVIRGDADEVIPTELSAKVAKAVPNLVEEVVFVGIGHNDGAMFGSRVADAVARLHDRLRTR